MRYHLPVCQQQPSDDGYNCGAVACGFSHMRSLGKDPRTKRMDLALLRFHNLACIAFDVVREPPGEEIFYRSRRKDVNITCF
eukprot:UN27787